MKRYYQVIKPIPGLTLNTCDIIERIGNKFYLMYKDVELPTIPDEIIANYTIEVKIHKPIFKINESALVKFDSGMVRPCFIINFNVDSNSIINHSFTGLNTNMDEWLQKSNNFFETYDDCLRYKKMILCRI